MDEPTKKSSPLLIAAAWATVIIPTAWGLNYTIQSAMKIFPKATQPTTASPIPPK
jgi:hypothetical protein